MTSAHIMWATVLSGLGGNAWGAGSRSAAELKEAAAHFERTAALSLAPAVTAENASFAVACRTRAETM